MPLDWEKEKDVWLNVVIRSNSVCRCIRSIHWGSKNPKILVCFFLQFLSMDHLLLLMCRLPVLLLILPVKIIMFFSSNTLGRCVLQCKQMNYSKPNRGFNRNHFSLCGFSLILLPSSLFVHTGIYNEHCIICCNWINDIIIKRCFLHLENPSKQIVIFVFF